MDRIAPATGLPETVPLVVVAADRETFSEFDLANVVPHATLTHLGAALSKSPFDLTPADTGRGVRRPGTVMRFNSPPGWPTAPGGWTPPPGWKPGPVVARAAPGWQLWLPDEARPTSPRPHEPRRPGRPRHPASARASGAEPRPTRPTCPAPG